MKVVFVCILSYMIDVHTFLIRKLKIRTYNLTNLVLNRLNFRFFLFLLEIQLFGPYVAQNIDIDVILQTSLFPTPLL